MSSSLEQFKQELGRSWSLINRINWTSPAFNAEKAYVTALFSKIAYLEIPDFEVPYHRLAKVVPCLTYWELIRRGIPHNVTRFLLEIDFGAAFVITTRYVVAVGVVAKNVIIVALRGTRPLYLSDWLIDSNISKTTSYVGTHSVKMHSGFYTAITECLDDIANEVKKRLPNSTIPLYVVGHSLGGAMAGIAFALDGLSYFSTHRFGATMRTDLNALSGFAFGMPRYGDSNAISALRAPYHVYNELDAVPGVPTRRLGYENVPLEYRIDEKGALSLSPQGSQGIGWWLSRANLLRGLRHHLIERYIENLHVAVGAH